MYIHIYIYIYIYTFFSGIFQRIVTFPLHVPRVEARVDVVTARAHLADERLLGGF